MLRIILPALTLLCWQACQQHHSGRSQLAMCHADFVSFANEWPFSRHIQRPNRWRYFTEADL